MTVFKGGRQPGACDLSFDYGPFVWDTLYHWNLTD